MDPEGRPRSWHPAHEDDYEDLSAELKRSFATWVTEQGIQVDPDAPELILHYKWGHLDGHLTRWTRDNLDELYLEIFPAKVILESDELEQGMDEARAFLGFLASAGLLEKGSEPADVLIEHLSRIEAEFRKNMADPSRYGMAKRFMTMAAADGVAPTDQEGLDAFIARFNARPREARDAVFTSTRGTGARPVRGRVTPPGTRPQPASGKRRKRRR